MSKKYFRGLGMEHLKDVAEKGYLESKPFEDSEVYETMRPIVEVYSPEGVVWMTDDRECAEIYAGEGGYLEIDSTDMRIVEDREGCYAVCFKDRIELDSVEKILVAETDDNRDHLLEVADKLTPEHGDIILESYERPVFEV